MIKLSLFIMTTTTEDIPLKGLRIKGEVYNDMTSRALYATDASMYQILPKIIAIPKDEEDVADIFRFCIENQISILPRGSATSLAGQTVNEGLVIDFTKYFDQVLQIDPDEQFAIVQPGVTRDQLNAACKKYGLHFAPDPATSSRATIGGMIANNSSGTKSILYGKTSDHVISTRVMAGDGFVLEFEDLDENGIQSKCDLDNSEGDIYRRFRSLIFVNANEIEKRFPKVMRRVSGYALDSFHSTNTWNLSKIICGSEGSLGIILEAKVKLTPLPKVQNMVIIHYNDREKGIDTVAKIVTFGPAAVEVLDYNVLQQSKVNAITKRYHDSIIEGDPDLVLTVEFYGQSQGEIDTKAKELVKYLQTIPNAYSYPIHTDMSKINDALSLRKDGLGLLMGRVEPRKPQAFVEDAAIPLQNLASYVKDMTKLCKDKGVEMVIYAHASVGVLHIRPMLDLTDPMDINLMKDISDESFDLVVKYGGSFSGEHGDGRNRGHRIKDFFGEQIYSAFKNVKSIFDPHSIFNPNIIIDTPSMDHNLRYGAQYKDKKYNFVYKYRKDGSFSDLVHMCSGVGECRKMSGGTMCPSFRATREEVDSTRGRANALRMAMSGQHQFDDLTDQKVLDTLDLCLSCKACKTECPSNVDMSKLKSEVLQLKYLKQGISIQERLPSWAPTMSRLFSGRLAFLVNFLQKTFLFRFMQNQFLSIHRDRILPSYASESLVSLAKKTNDFKSDKKVLLFADTYINYHQPEVGLATIKLLNKLKYEVIIEDLGCCQRPLISNGHLIAAKDKGAKTVSKLRRYLEQGIPILTVEPSCHTALLDDLPDLLENEEDSKMMSKQVITVEDFMMKVVKEDQVKIVPKQNKPLIVHGHCHLKSNSGLVASQFLLKAAGADFKILDTGCCGMAGAFGYEKNHYELSKKIAYSSLIPQIETNPDAIVVANGYSCKHQIKDFATRETKHIVEVIDIQD
jgi:FAD/FMN-containing dehydrogenase/Fe-S oxidoreductase